MEKKIARKAKRFNKAHKRKKIWHRFVSCLAIFVVFWTTYALVLPAITLDSNDYDNGALDTGIQNSSGLETIYARIVKYDDLQSFIGQPRDIIIFAKSGDNYYAFGSAGEAIPITLTGPLQEGTLVTYTNEDVSSAMWLFQSFFNTGYNRNLDVSIQSEKTGDYFKATANGFFYNSEDLRPGFYDVRDRIAQGANIDAEIATGLWTWISANDQRILQYKNGQFLNTQLIRNQDICGGQVTDIQNNNMLFDETTVVYCAVVDEVVRDSNQDLVAQVMAREDIWDSVGQGNTYVLFAKNGNRYYAITGTGEAVEINVQENLEEGTIIRYEGNNARNISWEFTDQFTHDDANNIDIGMRNVQTRQYLSLRNGNIFSNSAEDRARIVRSIFSNIRWTSNRHKYC